ncbi:MAG: O-antigen ligase family protein [Parvularculaceae bacterium]|nr:O-antigen ligase family protein [Parvularculaceae bacterium]
MLFIATMMAPLLLFSYRDFWVVTVALWLSAFPLAVFSWDWVKTSPRWLWALAALLAYALAATLWSPSDRSSDVWAYVILMSIGGPLLVHGKMRPELFLWAVFGAIVLLLVDTLTGNLIRSTIPPEQTPLKDALFVGRGLTLALLLLPAAALISYRTGAWRLGRGMIILTGLAAASAPVEVNGLLLMGGLLMMIATAFAPKVGLRLVVGVGITALLAPFILSAVLPPVETLAQITFMPESFVHRLITWRHVLDTWLTSNVFIGEGVRASSELFVTEGTLVLPSGTEIALVSVHPHNFAIETLYELGFVGYGLLVAAGFFAARELLRAELSRDMAAAIAALAWGSMVVMSLDYSMWSEFLPCTMVISAFAMRQVARKTES